MKIRVGDTVEIQFAHNPEGAFLAEVEEVTDRTTMGQDACITYRRHDGTTKRDQGMDDMCSVSHVTKVITRSPYMVEHSAPTNIFAKMHDRGWSSHRKVGGVRIAYNIDDLAMLALASAHDELVRPFDNRRFASLWAKASYIGLVTSPDEETYPADRYTCVRWKAFKRFVLANRHRFLCSRTEMMEMGRDYNNAMWGDDYEAEAA